MAERKFKENDRVKRLDGSGAQGSIKALRYEVTATSAEAKEKSLMICIAWDNGTQSYISPESLSLA